MVVMSKSPFRQKNIDDKTFIRMFSKDVLEESLEWHRDSQDRLLEVINGNGWLFQRDNSVPIQMNIGDTV